MKMRKTGDAVRPAIGLSGTVLITDPPETNRNRSIVVPRLILGCATHTHSVRVSFRSKPDVLPACHGY